MIPGVAEFPNGTGDTPVTERYGVGHSDDHPAHFRPRRCRDRVADDGLEAPKRAAVEFRRGMWVWDLEAGRVAVLVRIGVVATIEYANRDGTTLLASEAPLGSLRQARWDEVPEPRRAHLDETWAREHGYL